MPYAFGHLFGSWCLAKLYEKLKRHTFSHLEWGLLLFGAILPDSDLLVDWTLGTTIHRGLTHSLLFAVMAGAMVYAAACFLKRWRQHKSQQASFNLFFNENLKPFVCGFAIAFGILTHIILDMALGSPGIRVLWPSTQGFWFFGIALYPLHEFFSRDIPTLTALLRGAVVDMAIGTAWVGYLWARKRIKF